MQMEFLKGPNRSRRLESSSKHFSTIQVVSLLLLIAANEPFHVSAFINRPIILGRNVERYASSRIQTVKANDFQSLRIHQDPMLAAAQLQTATIPLKVPVNGGSSFVEVDLISILHVADEEFYHQIERDTNGYDAVLFEMIVQKSMIGEDAKGRRRIVSPLYPSAGQLQLARQYGLRAQLEEMDHVRKRHWYLADMDRESIVELQRQRGEVTLDGPDWAQGMGAMAESVRGSRLGQQFQEVVQALTVGRPAINDKVLPRFFLPGASWGRALRSLLWLTPCPELQVMVMDWSRTFPRTGTFSKVASLIADAVLCGDLRTARKLGFAQMLVSSQVDGGAWGGSRAGSTAVLVAERNKRVVEEVRREVLDESQNQKLLLAGGRRRIAVLYGSLHMQDLVSQLQSALGAQVAGPNLWRTAWTIPLPPSAFPAAGPVLSVPASAVDDDAVARANRLLAQQQYGKPVPGSEMAAMIGKLKPVTARDAVKLALVPAYLAIGAWDWSDLLRQISASGAAAGEDGGGAAGVAILLYLVRHAYLYYALSKWIVQWNEKMFDSSTLEP